MDGLSASDVAETHLKDLGIQDRYGVRFLTYWFDEPRGTAFCLVEAPSIEAAMRVHHEAHGAIAGKVIEVQLSAVEAFLGRVADPDPPGKAREPAIDGAFRSVLFTDIVNSTGMTTRLGDVHAVEMVRAHDAMVRRALVGCGGREVKHTGDGIMASFDDVAAAAACACSIQRAFAAFNRSSREPLRSPYRHPCRRAGRGQQRSVRHDRADRGAHLPGSRRGHDRGLRDGARPVGRYVPAERNRTAASERIRDSGWPS